LDLAVSGGAFSPSFASGGTALIFHAGRNDSGRLFQASLDNSGRASAVTPLLESRGRTYHARLSADGKWIAFDSDRDGERGVYVASRDGAQVARVSGEGFAAVPSWSPDSKWLAFVRAEPNRPKVWNLWLRDVRTGTLERQTAFKSGQVWGASWFPDSRLCYSHEDELIVADLAAGTTRTFQSPMRGRLVRTPAVSPNGNHIVFQVYRDGVWLLDVKTGGMRRVLDDSTAEEFAWDPSGRQVAYHSRRDGEWRIWVLPI
jgi:Tol biopolymer transport system component